MRPPAAWRRWFLPPARAGTLQRSWSESQAAASVAKHSESVRVSRCTGHLASVVVEVSSSSFPWRCMKKQLRIGRSLVVVARDGAGGCPVRRGSA